MRKKWVVTLLTICLAFGSMLLPPVMRVAAADQTVLVTAFPIFQIVRNVTQGRDGVQVDLMLPSQLGCPHDYALTPQDMQKLAKADILVVNGLGMEEFLGAPVNNANPHIKVIESATGITATLHYTEDQGHAHGQEHAHGDAGSHGEGHDHGHHGEHPFEWAGAFTLDPGTYRWSFAKVDGKYADPGMKMVYVASDLKDPIEHVEDNVMELFEGDGQALKHGGRLHPGELYALQFDGARNATEFEIGIEKAGTYVFFTEHMPSEFEAGDHFFKTAGGKDVEPVLQEPEHAHAHHHGEGHDAHGHGHQHAGVNPHLFASPRMTAQLAMNIAAELSKVDPNGAATYFKNAQAYAETMNRLADEMAARSKRLKNNRIVQPHGIFDYLARDLGLEIVAVMQAHGQEPSASEMMQLVKTIKDQRAGAIFTEPQYPEKVGQTLSKETGIPVAMLDPVATGPENAPLTYYETVMRQNMQTLESTLGVK
ncbi:MAG: zinc ABC transporter substrate-binding protein [Desulfobacteraceae bacterium]|jgi:ABC-type Zn uptake system ZnuABC Zn-binding protein ZnuA